MAHARMRGGTQVVEVFALVNDEPTSLGFIERQQPLKLEDHSLALRPFKQYMALQVYNRPQEPVLVLGSLLMLAGLIWHFYFRHREQRPKQGEKSRDA
jgi:hypothetical protein